MTEPEKPKRAACPLCGKPAAAPFQPFCSARCKKIDLNRWLAEVYRVSDSGQAPEKADSDEPSD